MKGTARAPHKKEEKMSKENIQTIGEDDVDILGSAPEGVTEEEAANWQSYTSAEQLEILQRNQGSKMANVSFEDALAGATKAETNVDLYSNEAKRALVGVPFVIRHIQVNQGQFGPFVSLTCSVKGHEKTAIINDGSTGIAAQTVELIKEHGVDNPILIEKGLKESQYYVDKDTRKVVGKTPQPNSFPQSTFYFDI